MCDPITIGAATLALGAAQSITQHVGTNQAYAANETAANYSYARDTEALGRQQVQIDRERSETVLDTAIAALQSQGQIAASASSQGLAQSSLVSSINASMFGVGRNATVEQINDRNSRVELANARTDTQIARQNQINSAPRSSLLSLGVRLGGNTLAGYNAKQAAKGA